jgi:hypothetical protein
MTSTIGRSKSYYHTIMTMTAIIGRSKSYYHTIMTMTAKYDLLLPMVDVMFMIVKFTSIYDSCHGHDCMIVRFTSTYDSCHGHDCMIVRFTSTYDRCHGHYCMIVMTAIIGRSKFYNHDHDSHHR